MSDWTAEFLKSYLSDKSIDKNTRIALGRVIQDELKFYGDKDRGLQKIYEVIDGVAQLINSQKDDQ